MYILSARYLIESPRWFLSQARTPEAESVLHYIARGLTQKNRLHIFKYVCHVIFQGNGLASKIDINLKPTPVHNSQTRDAVAMLLTRCNFKHMSWNYLLSKSLQDGDYWAPP